MISKVNGTSIDEQKAREACAILVERSKLLPDQNINLSWLDEETQKYIDFWFAPLQKSQLRRLSYFLIEKPFTSNTAILNVLKIAVSRLIVTKEPKASLARDTAHSRPHRTIVENDFNVFDAIPNSLDHVLKALQPEKILRNVKSYRGDARRMGRVTSSSIDCVVTSPPYLNAIDYMRGHRLSLVWLGYDIATLRRIRARSVGTEVADSRRTDVEFCSFLASLHGDIDDTKRGILRRYYRDLCGLTEEVFRVLRINRSAVYVIGNSNIRGHEVQNSELLVIAAKRSGLHLRKRLVREIPENRRYMPLVNSGQSSLSKRMRSEHVLVFEKTVKSETV